MNAVLILITHLIFLPFTTYTETLTVNEQVYEVGQAVQCEHARGLICAGDLDTQAPTVYHNTTAYTQFTRLNLTPTEQAQIINKWCAYEPGALFLVNGEWVGIYYKEDE